MLLPHMPVRHGSCGAARCHVTTFSRKSGHPRVGPSGDLKSACARFALDGVGRSSLADRIRRVREHHARLAGELGITAEWLEWLLFDRNGRVHGDER